MKVNESQKSPVLFWILAGTIAGVLTGFTAILPWILDFRHGGNPNIWQMITLVIVGWGYAILGYRRLKR